ncbi:MAG: MCE family protein [Bacteroidetes bacterium]|nr:MCE family protein [Bacteroidota bacterium]
MKKNAGTSIKLGIFVSLGLILFIAAIYFIGEQKQLFSSVFTVKGMFKDVNGLKVGNNVRFAGINVGTVSTIEILSDSCVAVEVTIDENVRKFIKKDATAVIGSEGLMGNKVMTIIPGTNENEPIKHNAIITTSTAINIDDILFKVKVTADNTAIISDQLAEILIKVNSGNGTIGRLLQDSTIAENINKTIINLEKSSKGLNENMEAAKHNILLKGYFKDKKKKEDKKKEESNKKN